MINTGLVIEGKWLAKILAGEKTWEIRGKPNKRSGRIALCAKRGPIVATAEIAPSIPLTPRAFAAAFARHRVTAEQLRAFYGERPVVYAWPLTDVRRLHPPIAYKHPQGGSWVKLSEKNVAEWARLIGR